MNGYTLGLGEDGGDARDQRDVRIGGGFAHEVEVTRLPRAQPVRRREQGGDRERRRGIGQGRDHCPGKLASVIVRADAVIVAWGRAWTRPPGRCAFMVGVRLFSDEDEWIWVVLRLFDILDVVSLLF
jgi:hypothetical protein